MVITTAVHHDACGQMQKLLTSLRGRNLYLSHGQGLENTQALLGNPLVIDSGLIERKYGM